MNKLRFAVQVVVLILAFPIWFYAEMKQADKAMQQNRQKNIDSIQLMVPGAEAMFAPTGNAENAVIPAGEHLMVSN